MRAAEGVVESLEEEPWLPDAVAVERGFVGTGKESVPVLVAKFSSEVWEVPVGAKLGNFVEVEMTAGSRKEERDGCHGSLWGCGGEERRRSRSQW